MAYRVNSRVLYRGCVHTIVRKTTLYELDGIVIPVEADELCPVPIVWTDKQVVGHLCDKMQIDPGVLLSRNRHAHIVQARQVICMYLRDTEKWTFERIGKAINRDHCTAIHHCRKFHNLIDVGDKLALGILKTIEGK